LEFTGSQWRWYHHAQRRSPVGSGPQHFRAQQLTGCFSRGIGNVLLENCHFEGNQNDIRAYATRSGSFGLIEVRNCTFVGNHDSFEPQLIPYIGDDGRQYYELEEVDASRDQNYGGASEDRAWVTDISTTLIACSSKTVLSRLVR
jgi:hypothetical protein